MAFAARSHRSGGKLELHHPGEDPQALRLAKPARCTSSGSLRSRPCPSTAIGRTSSHPSGGAAAKEGRASAQQDYFTGFIGQMGTQFDAFGHQGQAVRMADGSLKSVYYNGFTEEELTGAQPRRGRPRSARRRARQADHHARHPRRCRRLQGRAGAREPLRSHAGGCARRADEAEFAKTASSRAMRSCSTTAGP